MIEKKLTLILFFLIGLIFFVTQVNAATECKYNWASKNYAEYYDEQGCSNCSSDRWIFNWEGSWPCSSSGTTSNYCISGGYKYYSTGASRYSSWDSDHAIFYVYTICRDQIINGTCGSAAKTYSYSETFPTGTYCSVGTVSPTTPTNPLAGGSTTWSCLGSGGGTNATCTATRASAIECKYTPTYAQKSKLGTGTIPSSTKCCMMKWDSTVLIPDNCWYTNENPNTALWKDCTSSVPFVSGGYAYYATDPTYKSCVAWGEMFMGVDCYYELCRTQIIPGVCGSANKVYDYSSTSFGSDSFCASGTQNPLSILFPSAGNSVSWTCEGVNGGTSATCTATRASAIECKYNPGTDGIEVFFRQNGGFCAGGYIGFWNSSEIFRQIGSGNCGYSQMMSYYTQSLILTEQGIIVGDYNYTRGQIMEGEGTYDNVFQICRTPVSINYLDNIFTEHNLNPLSTETLSDLAVGDIDKDGDLDYATFGYPYSLRIYKNNGDGNFTQNQQFTNISVFGKFADVDSDGDLDIVSLHSTAGLGQIYLNNGNGNFSYFGAAKDISEAHVSIGFDVGDIDGDGDVDIVEGIAPVDSSTKIGNRIYLNNGHGVFTFARYILDTGYTRAVALVDVDSDDDLDYISANAGRTPNRVFLNDGTGNFSFYWESTEQESTHKIATGDFDKDEDIDFIVGNEDSGALNHKNHIYLNDGTGRFTKKGDFIFTTYMDIVAGDFSGEGSLDFIEQPYNSSSMQIYLNDGSTNFSVKTDTNAIAMLTGKTGDFDCDGDLDYLAVSSYGPAGYGGQGYAYLYTNNLNWGDKINACKAPTPINGTCGTANKVYDYTSTSFGSDSFCASGIQNPSSILFPNAGSSVSWTCNGINGGTSVTCSASRTLAPIDGNCGSAAKSYSLEETFLTTYCSTSVQPSPVPTNPLPGTSSTWDCNGLYGGLKMSCTATRENSPIIMPGGDTNSIISLTGTMDNGSVFVTAKCTKNTKADLNIFFSNTQQAIDIQPYIIDCNEGGVTTQITLDPLVQISQSRLLLVTADITKHTANCSVCARQTYLSFSAAKTGSNQMIPDSSPLMIVILFISVLLIMTQNYSIPKVFK